MHACWAESVRARVQRKGAHRQYTQVTSWLELFFCCLHSAKQLSWTWFLQTPHDITLVCSTQKSSEPCLEACLATFRCLDLYQRHGSSRAKSIDTAHRSPPIVKLLVPRLMLIKGKATAAALSNPPCKKGHTKVVALD